MLKVLLIDDEQWILEDLKMIIDWEKEGFQIIGCAQNTKLAWRLIKIKQPDLIICDIKMPEEDGIHFLRRLRANKIETKLLFLTAHGRFEYAKEAIDLRASGYLLKPVNQQSLIKELLRIQEDIIEDKSFYDEGENVTRDNDEASVINLILEDVHKNYNEKIQLADYASKYYVNASYLSQRFKLETGKSFTAYVLDVRLKKGEELLRETNYAVSQISEMIGYEDQGHFSKLFKKYKGNSPQNYRQYLQGKKR